MAPILFYILLIVLVALTQLAAYGTMNIYEAGALSFVIFLGAYLLKLNHKTIGLVLDAFFCFILFLMVLEGLIKLNLIGFWNVDEMLRKIPHYRWDVFRLTAFHGTPLLLSPVAAFYLLREVRGHRRPLFILLIWLMIFSTGSRSSLLVGAVIQIISSKKITASLKNILLVIAGASGVYASLILLGYDAIKKPLQRSLEGFDLVELFTQDDSVAGRIDTSLAAIIKVLESFQGIMIGVENPITSDSAIASIAQQSGILATFTLYFTIFFLSIRLLSLFDSLLFVAVATLLSLSVGGALALTPLFVALLYLLEFAKSSASRPHEGPIEVRTSLGK